MSKVPEEGRYMERQALVTTPGIDQDDDGRLSYSTSTGDKPPHECWECDEPGPLIAGHCVDIDGYLWHDCRRTERAEANASAAISACAGCGQTVEHFADHINGLHEASDSRSRYWLCPTVPAAPWPS